MPSRLSVFCRCAGGSLRTLFNPLLRTCQRAVARLVRSGLPAVRPALLALRINGPAAFAVSGAVGARTYLAGRGVDHRGRIGEFPIRVFNTGIICGRAGRVNIVTRLRLCGVIGRAVTAGGLAMCWSFIVVLRRSHLEILSLALIHRNGRLAQRLHKGISRLRIQHGLSALTHQDLAHGSAPRGRAAGGGWSLAV
jgi:hypothetical protein